MQGIVLGKQIIAKEQGNESLARTIGKLVLAFVALVILFSLLKIAAAAIPEAPLHKNLV